MTKLTLVLIVVILLLIFKNSFIFCVDNFNAILFTDDIKLGPNCSINGEKRKYYEQFLGIPFAQPPIGDLRFRNPQSVSLWSGHRIATTQVNHCWQLDPLLDIPASGTEDCLYLNIYRPSTTPKTRPLRVVVYLHGGGFQSGSNSPSLYGPEYFMETSEVVLVVPSYRVNVFGFLSTGDESTPGNYGLKDQSMALRWVRDNVAAFGGDPKQVTLMGHEAGAVAVNYHLIARQSEGLFHKAVMFSGMVDMPWMSPLEQPRDYVNALARIVNIKNPEKMTSEILVDILRSIPAKNLTQAMQDMNTKHNVQFSSYLPTVDKDWTNNNPFISEYPEVAMQEGKFQKMPILATIVPGDGIKLVQPLLTSDSVLKEFNKNIHENLPLLLKMDPTHPHIKQIVDEVRFQYFNPSGFVIRENLNRVLEMSSDYFFKWQYFKNMQLIANSSQAPVYGHLFNYRGLNSFSSLILASSDDFGVVNGDDQLYLFRMQEHFPVQLGPMDIVAKNLNMNIIMNFVRTGDPGYKPWTTKSPKMATLSLNDKQDAIALKMVPAQEMEFWDRIEKLYRNEKN